MNAVRREKLAFVEHPSQDRAQAVAIHNRQQLPLTLFGHVPPRHARREFDADSWSTCDTRL